MELVCVACRGSMHEGGSSRPWHLRLLWSCAVSGQYLFPWGRCCGQLCFYLATVLAALCRPTLQALLLGLCLCFCISKLFTRWSCAESLFYRSSCLFQINLFSRVRQRSPHGACRSCLHANCPLASFSKLFNPRMSV